MNKVLCVFTFSLGVVTGASAAWMLARTKFERLAGENIESVRQAYLRRTERESGFSAEDNSMNPVVQMINPKPSEAETESLDFEKPDLMSYYSNKIHREGYSGDDKKSESVDLPYIIPPEAFGELDEYDQISLTYYADGVLADENDEVIDNGEEIVGKEALNRLGKYEDDSVFVRNDRLKTDYEVLSDQRDYSDI